MIAGPSSWDQSACQAATVLLQSVAKHFDGRNLQLYLKQVYFESPLSPESFSLSLDTYSTYCHLQARKSWAVLLRTQSKSKSVLSERILYLHLNRNFSTLLMGMYCGQHWVIQSTILSLRCTGSHAWATIKVLVFPAPGYCNMISFHAEFYRQWAFRAIQTSAIARIYLTKYVYNTYLILTFQIALTSGEEVFTKQ